MNVGLKNDEIDSLGPLGQKSVPNSASDSASRANNLLLAIIEKPRLGRTTPGQPQRLLAGW